MGENHRHGIVTRQDDYNVSSGNRGNPSWGGDEGSHGVYHHTQYAGNHSHSASIGNKGNSESHENRPPYYALCYIMYISN